MSKHIYISQNTREPNTPTAIVKKIYDMVINNELTGDVYDNTTNFIGTVALANPTYKEWVDKISGNDGKFSSLVIESLYYMLFQDPAVESLMANYLLSKGIGDGIGITYDDAKSNLITALPDLQNNTSIQYFNELPYFEKITNLKRQQFKGCTNLKEINLSNIETIQIDSYSTFSGCESLEKITLGRLLSIPNKFAWGCGNLVTVENTDNVTSIGSEAFLNCIHLENINLSNVQSIGTRSIEGCTSLEEVDLTSIQSLSDRVFYKSLNLKLKYSELSNLVSIGKTVFYNTKISSIEAVNCISIDNGAFNNCQLLTYINFPSLQTLGSSVFMSDQLLNINVNFPNLNSIGVDTFRSSGINKISNLGNITSIPNSCFRDCQSLTVIENNALDNITNIGEASFHYCITLTSIGTLSNLISIGNSAFSQCKLLTNITLPPTVTTIGNSAFEECTSLIINDLNLPNLTSIGTLVFKKTKIQQISSLGNITVVPQECFRECKSLTTITNNALSNIQNYSKSCFYQCSSLSSANLSTNTITINDYVFTDCTSLIINDLNLPNLTSIGNCVFRGTKIKKISNLGNNITTIPQECFKDCKELTTIENDALSNITEIGNRAFCECTALTTIGDTSNVVRIEDFALYGTSINYLNLSNVKYIGQSGLAFNLSYTEFKLTETGCIDMRNIETLSSWVFSYKNSYLSVNSNYIDFGTHLSSVGTEAFMRINANVIIRSAPPTISGGYSNLKSGVGYYVYVPAEYLSDYQTTFSDYSNKFKTIENDLPAEYK